MTDSTVEATSFNQTTVDWWRPPPSFDPAQAPPWPADTAAIDHFQEDGAVLLHGVFDEWVEPLRAGLERNLAAPQDYAFPCESAPAGEPGRFFDSYCNWLAASRSTCDYVRPLLRRLPWPGSFMGAQAGPNSSTSTPSVKEPGTQRATPWHQDLPYYCVDGMQTACTLPSAAYAEPGPPQHPASPADQAIGTS